MSIGDFPESLSQAMLVGMMLVGRLGVLPATSRPPPHLSFSFAHDVFLRDYQLPMCLSCLVESFTEAPCAVCRSRRTKQTQQQLLKVTTMHESLRPQLGVSSMDLFSRPTDQPAGSPPHPLVLLSIGLTRLITCLDMI